MKNAKIIFVAILVEETEDGDANIADCINETLRPAYQDPEGSGIIDYAFNLGRTGEDENLPLPIPYQVPDDYEEGEFLSALRGAK